MTPPLNARIARAVASWPEADQIDFQERAGVLEYCADLLRGDAEERAFLMQVESRGKGRGRGGAHGLVQG
jgi:acyl-CoA reductase-like NAD-dependent aldehyde dehydrogenase